MLVLVPGRAAAVAPGRAAAVAPGRWSALGGEPVEGGEDVVEPGERHALVRDAAAQHDVLELPARVERAAGPVVGAGGGGARPAGFLTNNPPPPRHP